MKTKINITQTVTLTHSNEKELKQAIKTMKTEIYVLNLSDIGLGDNAKISKLKIEAEKLV